MSAPVRARIPLPRFVTFNLVGVLGAGVHLGVLSLLARGLGLYPAVAGALAVEAALLHNFFWHERWTWADRARGAARRRRLIRFHGINGTTSLVGSLIVLPLLVRAGMPVEVAGLATILTCSFSNFVAADRIVFIGAAVGVLAAGVTPATAGPNPEALAGWRTYVAAVESKRAAEPWPGDVLRDSSRRALLAGAIDVDERQATDAAGRPIDVTDGRVHHWRGRIFVSGIELDTLLERVRSVSVHRAQPDVRDARILREDADNLDLFLRITRSQFVTATYDTEHRVHYQRFGASRATATSIATRITEIGRSGDRGFLWRLNAYWRYEAVEGGVIVECESISLSRDVPLVLRPVAGPLVRSFARESMVRTLTALRDALRGSS
jgi:putative flippase GtrA